MEDILPFRLRLGDAHRAAFGKAVLLELTDSGKNVEVQRLRGVCRVEMDLPRFRAAPSARLSHLPFKSDRTFPAQC